MLVGAIAELVAIGTILPFLSVLADPAMIDRIGGADAFLSFIGLEAPRQVLLAVTALFIVAALASGVIRLWLTWVSQAFVFRLGHDYGVEIQRRTLYQPYSYHVTVNASQTVAALEKVQTLVFSVLSPLMLGVTAAIISVAIIGFLIFVDPISAIAAAGAFAIVYVLVSVTTKGRLQNNGAIINTAYGERVQAVQEMLGGIRDVILDHSQPIFLAHFTQVDARFRRAQTVNAFIGMAPRYLIETAGLVLMAIVALMLSTRNGGLTQSLPVIGALALGAQRLLPLLQQVYFGWAQVRGNGQVVIDVATLLNLPMRSDDVPLPAVSFRREIRFEGLTFRYPGRVQPVLRDIDLSIPQGSRIALIGKTGGGKSTLIDMLMGLLVPSEGRLLIDGVELDATTRRGWQTLIAHVPQAIFLSDTSVMRNIAFGQAEETIDMDRVISAAKQAQLHDFIETLRDGYATRVGERGVQLSGGQRQRLGIARALYRRPQVLILDEATSALDATTETEVMEAIKHLDRSLTIVMIAHRISTIAECDQIVRLDNGRIVQVGSFSDVVNTSHS